MGTSQTRDRTRVPCTGRQILNQRTTREGVLLVTIFPVEKQLLDSVRAPEGLTIWPTAPHTQGMASSVLCVMHWARLCRSGNLKSGGPGSVTPLPKAWLLPSQHTLVDRWKAPCSHLQRRKHWPDFSSWMYTVGWNQTAGMSRGVTAHVGAAQKKGGWGRVLLLYCREGKELWRMTTWLMGSGSRFTMLIGDLEKINRWVAGGLGRDAWLAILEYVQNLYRWPDYNSTAWQA